MGWRVTDPAALGRLLDACVHCGLCLPACPTYGVAGSELDSPRGRIDLVRGVVEGTLDGDEVAGRHLDRCLGCRACETACPSGVRYGAILEAGRARLAATRPLTGPGARALAVLASPVATRWAMRAAVVARATGLLALARRLPGAAGVAGRLAPHAAWTPWSAQVGPVLAATPPRRGAVALLSGCVMDQGFPGVHDASARCLRAAGFDVHVPRGPLCCGALHAHVGASDAATACGARLAAAYPRGVDALIVDAAGCGSHLKETPGPWAGRTFDVLEFLDGRGLRAALGPVAQRGPWARDRTDLRAARGLDGEASQRFAAARGGSVRVVYADPCHLAHGQGVRAAPRRLLAAIPDAELVPLRDAETCCGSAGIYNLAQPEMADELLRRKVECVREAAPHVVATANPGCHLQIAAGLRAAGIDVPVVHVVELLAMSLVA